MKEILRLTQENNKMLRSMRRGTFIRTIFQFLLYAAVAISALYFYSTYMAPALTQINATVEQIQGTRELTQAQFGSFQEMLKTFAEKFKTSTTTQ